MHTANDMLKATMRESLKHANVNWIKSKIKPRTHKKKQSNWRRKEEESGGEKENYINKFYHIKKHLSENVNHTEKKTTHGLNENIVDKLKNIVYMVEKYVL